MRASEYNDDRVAEMMERKKRKFWTFLDMLYHAVINT
jgi:hypothetical protein